MLFLMKTKVSSQYPIENQRQEVALSLSTRRDIDNTYADVISESIQEKLDTFRQM